MEKIIMLGVGHGTVLDLYNTCFVIQNDNGNFLVDTGGSIDIIKRLKIKNIELNDIKHIFISHSHTDHILGLIWMLKGFLKGELNIYCNNEVYKAIEEVSKQVLSSNKIINYISNTIKFHILEDQEQVTINGIEYKFIDIQAQKVKQFGFECNINNQRLIFLGDETINPIMYDKVKGADYVMHEAFCLDSEEEIFHAYEKNHSTVKNACEIMDKLDVKNLILYHTEDSHGSNRKKLYKEEGKKYFKGNLIIPDDLEEIQII